MTDRMGSQEPIIVGTSLSEECNRFFERFERRPLSHRDWPLILMYVYLSYVSKRQVVTLVWDLSVSHYPLRYGSRYDDSPHPMTDGSLRHFCRVSFLWPCLVPSYSSSPSSFLYSLPWHSSSHCHRTFLFI